MSLANAFVLALFFKILSAAFAATQPENVGFTWLFGFWLPIIAMIIYMVYGYIKTKKAPLDDQLNYGDSCYYLGFLFTIASIILALYIIGKTEGDFDPADLAIRVAAAMVTTLLGMAMRVYWVTFGKRRLDQNEVSNDGRIHGDEPSGGSSQEIYIEAHLKNLEKLNKSLVLNIDATERLRNNLVNLGARITNDIEVNCKAFQTFMEEMVEQTRTVMQNHQNEFHDAMSASVMTTKEQLSTLITESTEQTQKYVEDSLKNVDTTAKKSIEKVDAVAVSSVEQVDAAVKNTIQKVDEVAQRSVDKIDSVIQQSVDTMNSVTELSAQKVSDIALHTMEGVSTQSEKMTSQLQASIENISNASKVFADRVSVETLPTQEWKNSLNKVSQHLDAVVDNFAKKTNAVVDTSMNVQKNVQDFGQTLVSSVMLAKEELNQATESFKQNARDAKQANEELGKVVHSEVSSLEQKMNQISQKSNHLSAQIQQLDHTIKTAPAEKKGFISRLFGK